jgi:hypothetical protein
MSRPRLLITLSINFGVRYLVRTGLLERIANYATPVVAMTWDDPELRREMELLGAETVLLPEPTFSPEYQRVRRMADTWHLWQRLRSPSTTIDTRRAEAEYPAKVRLLRRARTLVQRLELTWPGAVERLLAKERALLQSDTNLAVFEQLLTTLRPDAVFSMTPYHRQEELILRAAALGQIPMCAAILSFDNLTTRGWIPVVFDRYLLWNRYNAAELRRAYPEADGTAVDIVGPAQFDFYSDPRYIWDELDWRQALGLPEGRPVILFGAGPASIVPHEPQFLEQIDDAIEEGELPGQPVILFRRHPMDTIHRWRPTLQRTRHVVQDDPWPGGKVLKHANIRHDDIARLVSTLRHSDVHLSVSSTMTLDGAWFDRPQIGPAYDDRPGRRYERICRELYEREHYLPITRSGGLAVVESRQEMIDALNQSLSNPAHRHHEREAMLRAICTYTDGQCTERVSRGIGAFLGADALWGEVVEQL